MCVVASTTRSRSDANIIAVALLVSAASISVCPGKSNPPANSADLSSGAVTIPSTSPCMAICTALSMALPASAPPRAASPPGLHSPTDTSAWAAVPDGPTTTKVAAARTAGSASAALTISGPIPRTSPSVTASRGSVASAEPRALMGSVGRRAGAIEDARRQVRALQRHHRDVYRLPLRIDVPAHLRHLLKIGADSQLHFVVDVIAGFGRLDDLGDHVLRKSARRRNRKRDDRIHSDPVQSD